MTRCSLSLSAPTSSSPSSSLFLFPPPSIPRSRVLAPLHSVPLFSSNLSETREPNLSMGDSEDAFAPSKKRAAGRELNRDKLDLDEDEDTSELESGTFKRASEEVLATRRIVKVRRNTNPASAVAPQPSKNPFAGISLVPPSDPGSTKEVQGDTASKTEGTEESESEAKESEAEVAIDKDEQAAENIEGSKTHEAQVEPVVVETVEERKDSEQTENQGEIEAEHPAEEFEASHETEQVGSETKETEALETATDNDEGGDPNAAAKPEEGDEKKAESEVRKDEEGTDSASGGALSSFQQLSSNKNAFMGLAGTGFSSGTFSFGLKSDQPSFSFGLSGNGNSSAFGSSSAPIIPKAEGTKFPSKEEVVVETGEENEKTVFSAGSILFEYIEGSWKERGKGEIKVNVSTTGTEKARLVMRTKGNLRLVMNARLFPEIKLANMDKKGITFACVNSVTEGKTNDMSTFALKFKDGTVVETFREAIEAHKGNVCEAQKTPENSPKASEE